MRPPGDDHAYLLLADGEVWAYVYEPYHLDDETMEGLVQFCKRYGLTSSMRPDIACHFPGGTVAVILRKVSP